MHVKSIAVLQTLSTFDEILYDLPNFPKKKGYNENLFKVSSAQVEREDVKLSTAQARGGGGYREASHGGIRTKGQGCSIFQRRFEPIQPIRSTDFVPFFMTVLFWC